MTKNLLARIPLQFGSSWLVEIPASARFCHFYTGMIIDSFASLLCSKQCQLINALTLSVNIIDTVKILAPMLGTLHQLPLRHSPEKMAATAENDGRMRAHVCCSPQLGNKSTKGWENH